LLRTNLSPLRVQRWALIGFNPWHRVLLRQSVADAAAGHGICPQFHVSDQEAIAPMERDKLLSQLSVAHVTIMTRETFLAISKSQEQSIASSLPKECIAILWDWSALGKESLSWATCVGFSGVIYNIATLRSWSNIAVQRGKNCLEEPHPILSQIELPSLARIRAPT